MLTNAFNKIKEWFGVAAMAAVAVLYFLLQRKSQQVDDLQNKVRQDELENKVHDAITKADQSEKNYNDSRSDYDAAKRANPSLFD